MLKNYFVLLFSFVALSAFSQLNIDSVGHLDLNTMHDQDLNDIWGYVDEFGNEYALVGGTKGTSVVDVSTPSNPVEVFYEPGMESIWRDLKTYGDYAYVTTEALNGLLIIDLSPLPASTTLPVAYYTGPLGSEWQSAHNLYIDENGYAYIFGANRGNGGVIILDVATDPMNPIEVGEFDNWYVHDGYAENDTMYLGHISDGFFSIVDVTDKANPILLGSHNTPSNFSHNVWTSNGNYAFTTDEVTGGYIGSYDISDPANIQELDRIQSSPGAGVIPHNAHVMSNYVITSYYSDGVTVHDITHPHNLIEVGNYDTYPDQTTSYDGCWGVYPYFPSGLMVASDITEGLFVLSPTYQQAAYLEGIVTNSSTLLPIDQVDVSISGFNNLNESNATGFYATGTPNGGTYNVTYSKVGYFPQTISTTLTNGVVLTQDVQLVPIPPYSFTLTVLEEGTNNPIDGADIRMEASLITHTGVTNALGEETFTLFYQEIYKIYAGKWGHITHCQWNDIDDQTGGVTVWLKPGVYDDFTFDFGWTTTGTASTGHFVRDIPNGTNGNANPGIDSDNDCNHFCYVTGNDPNPDFNVDDVDGGEVVLRSPIMDLTSFTDPYVNYERWFYCEYGVLPPGDSLEVFVNDGTTTTRIDMQGYDTSTYHSWNEQSIRLLDYTALTSTMQFIFRVADEAPEPNITEVGVDHFFIVEAQYVDVNEMDAASFSVYPNPASTSVSVKGLFEKAEYQVLAMNGKMALEGVISPESNVIDISTLENGVYFVQIENKVQKLVISK
jgi:choice-of-anchor B domain-containing protein